MPFQLGKGARHIAGEHEPPDVAVSRLAQHLTEESPALFLIVAGQRSAQLRDGRVLVPEEIGAALLLR